MGRPNQATKAKRDRERQRQERQEEKQLKRESRGGLREERERLLSEGIDPDLVGIIPGPQPPNEDS